MVGWNARAWTLALVFSVAVGCTKDDGSGGGSAAGSGGSGGSAGTGADGGSGGGTPAPTCERSEQCDDGLFCNGSEICQEGRCAAGALPDCDDGIECTTDRCDESRNACDSTAPDNDRDGHADATCLDDDDQPLGDDCDDSDSTRYPGALEICDADAHDEDCDLSTFGRVDYDGDTYLNANCCNRQLDNTLLCGDDCDDFNARVHPFNTESCDGLDNDCNGLLDHPLEDQDGDGHATTACGGTDCDDFSPMTYAGAMELCDGFDNDCIQGGGIAEDELDLDSDAFVSGVCMPMDEIGLGSGDCDDDRPSASPMEQELCNGLDDDCDGAIDERLDCESAVKEVDAYANRTCALRVNGTVACWGHNSDGTLGTGADGFSLDYPRSVIDRRHPSGLLSDVRSVAVGNHHACAVHLDGRISCWGDNALGQLGTGTLASTTLAPTGVVGIDDAAQVCAGDLFGCARRVDGRVSCWGENFRGQLGNGVFDGSATPVLVGLSGASVDLDCHTNYACAVLANGAVECWGDNTYKKLGDATDLLRRNTPTQVIGLNRAKQVSTARNHVCALRTDDSVYCWGDNAYGQRGNGTTTGTLTASPLQFFDGTTLANIIEVSTGGDARDDARDDRASGFTCVRTRDGSVHCVGHNYWRQLGYGESTGGSFSVWQPARALHIRYAVDDISDAIQISLGHQHACAVRPDGTLTCWGANTEGQRANSESMISSVEGL